MSAKLRNKAKNRICDLDGSAKGTMENGTYLIKCMKYIYTFWCRKCNCSGGCFVQKCLFIQKTKCFVQYTRKMCEEIEATDR